MLAILIFFTPGYTVKKSKLLPGFEGFQFMAMNISIMTLNVYIQVSTIIGEAKLLDLSFLEYAFYCVVAMTGFFPYQHQFMSETELKVEKDLKGIKTFYVIGNPNNCKDRKRTL